MADFVIKVGDRGISMSVTLKDENGVIDLTGGSTAFSMRDSTSKKMKVTDTAMTQVTPASGIARYDWLAADVDTAGSYEGEVKHTTAGGLEIRFPRSTDDGSEYLTIEVIENIT